MKTNTAEYKAIGIHEIFSNGWKQVDVFGKKAEAMISDMKVGTKCGLWCETPDGRRVVADFTLIGVEYWTGEGCFA